MHRTAIATLGLVGWMLTGVPVSVRAQERNRPLRVGNTNLVLFGVGASQFDHPTFEDQVVPSLMYERRVLRRESRAFPIWLRGAIAFLSQNRTLENAYTVWPANAEGPFIDDMVHEHTSDFTVRGEILADVLHRPNWALYGGVGFAAHAINFSSDGSVSRIAPFETSASELAPSVAAGGRLFSVKRPYVVYGEVRWGKAYGRNEAPPGGPAWLTDQSFEFTSVDAWSLEGGVGFHW